MITKQTAVKPCTVLRLYYLLFIGHLRLNFYWPSVTKEPSYEHTMWQVREGWCAGGGRDTYGLHPGVLLALYAGQPDPAAPHEVEQPHGDVHEHDHEDVPYRQPLEDLAAVLPRQDQGQHRLHANGQGQAGARGLLAHRARYASLPARTCATTSRKKVMAGLHR